MQYDLNVVLICDAAKHEDSNNLIAMLYGDGLGSGELSVPLSATGELPATHYGADAMMTEEMAAALEGFQAGAFGAHDLAPYSLTEASAQEAAAAMTIDVASAPGRFASVIASLGLAEVAI